MTRAGVPIALNITLRGATMAARLLLIFILARFLAPSEVGVFGLFTATVAYALYLVGLDFYTYTTREIIASPTSRWGVKLKGHIALAGLLYALLLPLLAIPFLLGVLSWPLAPWFLALLVLEHVGQEMDRFFIAARRPLLASVLMFVRLGAWVIVCVPTFVWYPETRSLAVVFLMWGLGGVAATVWGSFEIARMGIGIWSSPVDWVWVRRGIGIATPLLFGTLALRSLSTADRYIVDALQNREFLGAYVVLLSMASGLTIFVNAAVFSFTLPDLVRLADVNLPAFRQALRRTGLMVVACSALYSAVTLILLPVVLGAIDNPVYSREVELYPWLLSAVVIYNLGLIPHYGLYAQGFDGTIVRSHVAGALVFLPFIFVFRHWSSSLAVPWSLVLAFSVIFLWKAVGLAGKARAQRPRSRSVRP